MNIEFAYAARNFKQSEGKIAELSSLFAKGAEKTDKINKNARSQKTDKNAVDKMGSFGALLKQAGL